MKTLSVLTGLLTLTVAIFSFTVSFVSLANIAEQYGFPIPMLLPLTIEAGVIIFSINALYRYLNQEKTIWQWSLVILSSSLALTFNVLHAQNNLISQVMFGIPSLFFLLSFENFLSQMSHITKKKIEKQKALGQLDSDLILKQTELKELENLFNEFQEKLNSTQTKTEQIENQFNLWNSKLEKIKSEYQTVKTELKKSKETLEQIQKGDSNRLELILDSIKNGNFKVNHLASELEVSQQTIYNDVKKLENQNLVSKNGKGWVVIR